MAERPVCGGNAAWKLGVHQQQFVLAVADRSESVRFLTMAMMVLRRSTAAA
jgi:hypothetical protein